LTAAELTSLRCRAQLLSGPPAGGVVEVLRQLGAVQAQAPGPPRLAIRARTGGCTAADVDRACSVDRSVVRTWLMRGTLHMVPAADVRWLGALFGPRNSKAGRRRREQLGLDEKLCQRALVAIEAVLRGGEPLTRAELIERIAAEGIGIDPKTQAPAHLMAYAANSGLICRGPERAKDEPTYVLLDEWVPDAAELDPDEALAELARRFLDGHGPAAPADFVSWSGLPIAEGRRAFELIADEVARFEIDGAELSLPADVLDGGELDTLARNVEREQATVVLADNEPDLVRLLGHFDPLLLGYRSRDHVLDPCYSKRIQTGGGFVQPAVLCGGRVIGTWQLDRSRRKARAVIEPFERIPKMAEESLAAEVADIGRFLGIEVDY
jgi:hypothetical protein